MDKTLIEGRVNSLTGSMELRKRDDGTEFYCFADKAPKELQDLFLKHYQVRDLDYQIFSTAIDTIIEAWEHIEDPAEFQDYTDDNYNEFASVYNEDRLTYLNVWNDGYIADIVKNNECESVSEACAYWYDGEVRSAIHIIISEYLNIN